MVLSNLRQNPKKMDAFKAPSAYEFKMDRWLPATLPMKRLAQYMDKLSALLGDVERVHFVKIVGADVILIKAADFDWPGAAGLQPARTLGLPGMRGVH